MVLIIKILFNFKKSVRVFLKFLKILEILMKVLKIISFLKFKSIFKIKYQPFFSHNNFIFIFFSLRIYIYIYIY